MRYAIITGGTVTNIVTADADFAAEQGWIEAPPPAAIGHTYDGQAFTAPVVSEAEARALIPPVTRRQARLALLEAGLLSGVETALAALPSPQKEAAQIEWADAAVFERDHTLIASMTQALGLTEAQVDDLFRAAASL